MNTGPFEALIVMICCLMLGLDNIKSKNDKFLGWVMLGIAGYFGVVLIGKLIGAS